MKFAVIGGDARSAWLAALLAGDGHAVRTFALEKAALPQRIAQCSSPEACAYGADWVLLGVPAEKGGVISAPLSVQKLTPGELLTALWPGQTLCGGRFAQETSLGAIRAGLSVCELMTRRDYTVRGCTALLDAVGDAIRHIKNIHKYARRSDVPQRTMFVITTDGMENASRRYSSDEVKRMIREQKKHGWEFLFIGANIDAVETARRYGISEDRAVNYHADSRGTAVVFEAVNNAVGSIRNRRPLEPCWSQSINDDYNSRNK